MSEIIATQMKALTELEEYLADILADCILDTKVAHGELTVDILRVSIARVLGFLRDDANCHFEQLVDIVAMDYPGKEERFTLAYVLLSHKLNQRIVVRLTTDEETQVKSAVGVFPNAIWYEREAWDMFGVYFAGNPDLRRLLSDYGFEGHPLRKDFPLSGFVEMRYDAEQARLVHEPVKLQQEYRHFDNLSPWEGDGNTFPPRPLERKGPQPNAADNAAEGKES